MSISPSEEIADLIEISTLSKRSGNIQLINNSDKRDGNTLLLSSQSYRKKSKGTVSECIKPRNKKERKYAVFASNNIIQIQNDKN